MKYLSKRIVYLSLIVYLLFSCKGKFETIPYTKVNFTVPIYANGLIHAGGYDYFTGGISGVVVYRLDMSTFYVYDRACPYDWGSDGRVYYDPASLQLICEKCGSTFNILNGYPMSDSKADIYLRPYQSRLIDDMRLHIYN